MENCLDICTYVGKFLSDSDKIHLSMCSTKLDKLKYIYHYENKIGIKHILLLPYYNNFTNIHINKTFEKLHRNNLPSSITNLSFSDRYSSLHYINIPPSVTHLMISNNLIFLINDCIPSTVTHLIFGKYFDRHIRYECPSRVTHLTFGEEFNMPITNMIPLSVTHLTFNGTLIESDIDVIPLTITHLSLRADCFFRIMVQLKPQNRYLWIPPSVTHLTIYDVLVMDFQYDNVIPSSVTNLLILPIDARSK